MTGKRNEFSSALPPNRPSKPRWNDLHPPTRKPPRETLRPFGREPRTFFVSGWRRRDRPKANLRKYRRYFSNCRNQKYEAISGAFVADETVSGEPVCGADSQLTGNL